MKKHRPVAHVVDTAAVATAAGRCLQQRWIAEMQGWQRPPRLPSCHLVVGTQRWWEARSGSCSPGKPA